MNFFLRQQQKRERSHNKVECIVLTIKPYNIPQQLIGVMIHIDSNYEK